MVLLCQNFARVGVFLSMVVFCFCVVMLLCWKLFGNNIAVDSMLTLFAEGIGSHNHAERRYFILLRRVVEGLLEK